MTSPPSGAVRRRVISQPPALPEAEGPRPRSGAYSSSVLLHTVLPEGEEQRPLSGFMQVMYRCIQCFRRRKNNAPLRGFNE